MFNQGGLSLQQAPPISVVLRFFITGAIFGTLLAAALLFFKERVFDIYSYQALIITHILTLGVMASFMIGALFQMLPVIAGIVLENPKKKALLTHLLFTTGVILLLGAFYSSNTILYLLSGFFLGASLLYISSIMIIKLFRLQNHSPSSKGMLLALLSFLITLIAALYLLNILDGLFEEADFLLFKQTHFSFGLFGWISILIISISFQVIEMFYVTPSYGKFISKYLPLGIFSILILKSVLSFFGVNGIYFEIPLFCLLIYYSFATLLRLYRRKRPTSDATVWFWRFAMISLIISVSIFTIDLFMQVGDIKNIGYISFIFFVLSVLFAMVYKIVPFLVWFHLSNEGYLKAPMMYEIIHPKRVKINFYIHILLFTVLLLCVYNANFFILASSLTLLSFGWLLYHLIYASYIYIDTKKNGEKISWG